MTRSARTGVDRRTFLKASGLAAGGLTIGVSLPFGALAKLSADGAAGFQPNAFLHLAPNGDATLWCGRCEMGQGISTALPAAVADELEADWGRVRVLQGDANEKYGPQATGGSRSINVMLEPMRKAGAAGREMLVAAAAEAWGLPIEACFARFHEVRNRSDDRVFAYGALADRASTMPVPEAPRLKARDEFRYIGKPLKRHDAKAIVTGQRVYGADVKRPGMKYAAIRHVPVLGGRVKAVDRSPIDGMADVVAVVEVERFENAYGSVGGVAVVADDTWTAQQAVAKLKIEWERGPNGSYDTEAYKAMLAAHVEQPGTVAFTRGDVDRALDQATVRHAATYVGGHLSHSPMEPMASAAHVTDDHCEIWASTQDPQGIQRTVGAFLGRPPEAIVVHVMASGGAFGRKFKCDYVQEAVALARAVSAPVQLTWSREEDTRTGYYHSCSAQHIEAGLDAGGRVTGWLHRAAFPPIPSTFDARVTRPSERDLQRIIGHPFRIANVRIEAGEAPAHTRIGWYRAVYDIFWAHAINLFVDELAEKAGTDNVTLLRRIYENGSDPEQREQAERSLAVLNEAVAMGGRGPELATGEGLGVAVHHSYESYTAMAVRASVKDGGVRVHRVDCVVDCGLVLNPDIATAQMEGAVIMGLGLALHTEVKFEQGAVVNSNFHDYPVLRIGDAPPEINVRFIGQEHRSTGLGEPGVPTFAPALAIAIHRATGKRLRSLPMRDVANTGSP